MKYAILAVLLLVGCYQHPMTPERIAVADKECADEKGLNSARAVNVWGYRGDQYRRDVELEIVCNSGKKKTIQYTERSSQ